MSHNDIINNDIINSNTCQAIINNKNGIHQCHYQKKYGEYCGIHRNHNAMNNIQNKKRKSDELSEPLPKKIKLAPQSPRIFTYEEYILSSTPINKLRLMDLKVSCHHYNLSNLGKKPDLVSRLSKFFNQMEYYHNNINHIKRIQSLFRGWRVRNQIKLHGIYLFNKSMCHNQEEFYTFDDIKEIDDDFFFSIKQDSYIFGFDIRSIYRMFNTLNTDVPILNPYTNQSLDSNDIERANLLVSYLERKDINIRHEDMMEISPQQEVALKATDVFQKMDYLGNHIDAEWFHQMNIGELKDYYRLLEDIWNYRANLSEEAKLQIVPSGNIFSISVSSVNHLNDKIKVQHIVLDVIDILVSSGLTIPDKTTGAFYVQAAFAGISPMAAQAMPHMMFIISAPTE